MTKKDFIWLVTRAIGLFMAFLSVPFIVSSIFSFFIMLKILSAEIMREWLILLNLSGIFLEGAFKTIIVVYLLFFGKTLFNIVQHTSRLSLENVLEKENYTEILIRFLGVWWLWRIVCQACGLISSSFYALILSNPAWLKNIFSGLTTDSLEWQELCSRLSKILHPLQQSMIWSILLDILIYSLLAWYFLKHGKFFINLLNRLWLKATRDGVNQNPVNPV
jgi:hypothetical protein